MERAEPELERTARRARRVVWAFRLIFYPGAILAAVLLLANRSESDPGTWLSGRTDQGLPFELRLQDERPTFLRTVISATCPWDEPWQVEWARGPVAPTPFRFGDDGNLAIGEHAAHSYERGWVGHRELTLQARVEDDRVTGRMSLDELLDEPGTGRTYRCESGTVDFSAAAR